MEVTELVDTGERHVGVVVVHDRGALEVSGGQNLGLEIEGAPSQCTFGVVEVAVERARVDDRGVGAGGAQFVADVEVIGVEADLDLRRSEEHTSELQSLMRISYAVFCL